MVADMVIDGKGHVTAYQFYPAVMHSAARLTYNEVWEALSQPDSRGAHKLAPLRKQLENLYAVFEVLARARDTRGALDLETTETLHRLRCQRSHRKDRRARAQRRTQDHRGVHAGGQCLCG